MTDPITVFICGSALSGQPDNHNLQGARLLGTAKTAPAYRLHSVADGWHPGIYPTDTGGISICGELYALTEAQFAHLKDSEPPNMYPHEITLLDGRTAIAFLYPEALIKQHNWPDISRYGGWLAYQADQGRD